MDSQAICCIITCLVLIAVVTIFYWHFGAFRQPPWASIFEIFSACIPVIMVCGILPYDISLSFFGEDEGTKKTLEIVLNVLYWTSFLLTWVIVPVAVSYLSYSHSISVRHRIWMVVRENLIFYGIAGGLVVVLIIAMIAAGTLKIKTLPKQLIEICVALGNGYGLLLLCAALGYGFVQLPISIWQNAEPSTKYKRMLNELFKETKNCAAAVADADAALEHWRKMRENIGGEKADKYLDLGKPRAEKLNQLKSNLPIPDRYYTSQCTNKKIINVRKINWSECTDANIEDFFCLMDQTAETLDQCTNFVNHCAENAENALKAYKESIEENKSPVKKYLKRIGCIVLALCILVCYYGEISLIFSKPEINIFYLIIHSKMSPLVGQIIVTFPILCFLSFIGGWTLKEVRIGSFYRFIPNASNGNTLNYWAILLCRLGPTIGYHYMLQIKSTKNAFVSVMGVMDNVIFVGKSWNYISPVLLLIISLFVAFNIWDRLKVCCKCGCSCCNDHSVDFYLASAKDLETGEEILKELSENVNQWIAQSPSYSVINISDHSYKDNEDSSVIQPLNA